MKEMFDIVYDKQHTDTCVLDMYLPESTAPFPVFIYFHGGGIENGSRKDNPELIQITTKGIALVSVDYRMYPGARFPEFIDDAASAINFVKEYGEKKNLFSGIYVGGSSAGAYLTMMTYFDSRYLGKYGISPESLNGWFFDAGQPTVHFNVLRERGQDTRLIRIDEAAPLHFVDRDKDSAMQSRLMFVVSDHDIVNRYEQTQLMLKTLEHFNYDMSKIKYKLMTDCTHCNYPIADMVSDFVWDIM